MIKNMVNMINMIKTRTIHFADGRQEIVRVLSATDLLEWVDQNPLAFEKSIVWLRDIQSLRYVRVVQVRCAKSRRGRLRVNSGESVVGYSKLFADAPRDPRTDTFTRRLFYLKAGDCEGTEHSVPQKAVDPRTIFPGVRGERPIN